jgi:hypothetical protein
VRTNGKCAEDGRLREAPRQSAEQSGVCPMMAIREQAKSIRRATDRFLRSISVAGQRHHVTMPVRATYPSDAAALRLYTYPRGFRQR